MKLSDTVKVMGDQVIYLAFKAWLYGWVQPLSRRKWLGALFVASNAGAAKKPSVFASNQLD